VSDFPLVGYGDGLISTSNFVDSVALRVDEVGFIANMGDSSTRRDAMNNGDRTNARRCGDQFLAL
jgi:hypothetical protein